MRLRRRRGREPGELVSLYQVDQLHLDGDRARRTGLRFIVAARSTAGAAVLLGLLAGVPLWWRPGLASQHLALATGGGALGFGVLWVGVVWRATRWLNLGVVTDSGSKAKAVAGLQPDSQGDPEWFWDTLRLAHLVLLCIPLAGLLLTFTPVLTEGRPVTVSRDAWWGLSGFSLLMTGTMGGIMGGLAFGMVNSSVDCWTPRGAVRRLLAYAVPFLCAAPWLTGLDTYWTGALAALAMLWLLIAPIMQLDKHIPASPSD